MGFFIFLAFLCVPIIEIIGFIQIGSLIGLWPTIGIVILTAIAGTLLLQYQGMGAWLEAQAKLRDGTLPVTEVIDGFCLALAGALLLTPGFFTDGFGFLLFVPAFRRGFARLVFEKIIKPNAVIYTDMREETGPDKPADDAPPDQQGSGRGPDRRNEGVVIDGTYENVSETRNQGSSLDVPEVGTPKPGGKPSPWRADDEK